MLNEVLLVENYYTHDLHVSDDGQLILTYQRLWESGNWGSEPDLDSAHIFLTHLDSLANPVGELWSLREDSSVQRWRPKLVGSDGNVSWLYTTFVRNGDIWTGSLRSQTLDDPQFPGGDELVSLDSSEHLFDIHKMELLNGQYMYFWQEEHQIIGQRFDHTNHLVGERFEIYNIEPSDSQFTYISGELLAVTNTTASQSCLVWVESHFEGDFPVNIFNSLTILPLHPDGTPSASPRRIKTIAGSIAVQNLFLQNDRTLAIEYRTEINDDTFQYHKWIHIVTNFAEANEMESIYQVPEYYLHRTSYFPPTGHGLLLGVSEASDSLKVQFIGSDGELLEEHLDFPITSHSTYPTLQALTQNGRLIVIERGHDDLYAHVYGLGESVSIEPEHNIVPGEGLFISNYPNPFNPSTMIHYSIPEQADVNIRIYDLLGREIWTREVSRCAAGYRSLKWNGLDNMGNQAGSGVYLITLSTSEFQLVQKAMLNR